jgi:hypothetical protein
VAEQVVQIAPEAQTFLGDGETRDLLPRRPQLRDGVDVVSEGRKQEA